MTRHSIVPSIMFHSVGLLDDRYWPMVNISEPVDIFRRKMQILKRFNYEFMHCDELYSYIRSGAPRSSPAIVLTFDDGYLDNWVYVYPILKELGIKATIYVNPDFVDPGKELRPTYDDVLAGRIDESELEIAGFLNWAEMRAMEASGLVDIQSHTMTHTWYFSSPKLLDFHNPSSKKFPWLAWNHSVDRKPFYMAEDQTRLVPFGTPIYEHEKALVCRRYYPPEEVATSLVDYVSQRGGETFFASDNWRQELTGAHAKAMERFAEDERYESEIEYEERIHEELQSAKTIIERELNKSVEYVCWPGGGYNDAVVSVARRLGFKSWTLASRDRVSLRNRPGSDPSQIARMGSSVKYFTLSGEECGYAGEYYFLSNVERHKGSILAKWIARTLRLFAVGKAQIVGLVRPRAKNFS